MSIYPEIPATFVERRSQAPIDQDSRRAWFALQLAGVISLSTSPRKVRRIGHWFDEVKGLGTETKIDSIDISVDELNCIHSELLGTDKVLKQVNEVNRSQQGRAKLAELEESGRRFVLVASCDVNSSVEQMGGGERVGMRKDKKQVEWNENDYSKGLIKWFSKFSPVGFTLQPERVDVLLLAALHNSQLAPLVIAPVVSKNYINVPGNYFVQQGSSNFAEKYVEYVWKRPGIGPELMAKMPLGFDTAPFLSYLLRYLANVLGEVDCRDMLPTVDMPSLNSKDKTWEFKHVQKKQEFSANELESTNFAYWAPILAQLDHELAGPVYCTLTAAFDHIRRWVDMHNIGPGNILSTTKGWFNKLPRSEVIKINSRLPENKAVWRAT